MLVGESAIWHEVESALYWVDIEGLTVNRLHAASGKFSSWKMGSHPSALAIDDNNCLVVATRHGLLRLNTTDGAETPIADAPYDPAKVRFNDGRVDPAGRFWIGTMYEPRDQPAAEMYVLARDNLRCAWRGGSTASIPTAPLLPRCFPPMPLPTRFSATPKCSTACPISSPPSG